MKVSELRNILMKCAYINVCVVRMVVRWCKCGWRLWLVKLCTHWLLTGMQGMYYTHFFSNSRVIKSFLNAYKRIQCWKEDGVYHMCYGECVCRLLQIILRFLFFKDRWWNNLYILTWTLWRFWQFKSTRDLWDEWRSQGNIALVVYCPDCLGWRKKIN